jgi:ribosomal protein S18 acetylase RimI-like enzyme
MDQDDWLRLNLRGMQAAFSSFGRAAGAEVLEREGLVAVVNSAVPERSVFNSVVYLSEAALAAAYDELASTYAEAGCAWTVWVPEEHRETGGLLDAGGHTLDAKPRAMGIDLSGVEEPDLSEVDWTDQGNPDEMAALNDAAYGYEPGTWIRGMGRGSEGLRIYVARVDDRPAATVSALDVDGDCAIWMVATAEWARGRGHSTALMRKAIFDAAQRGCPTSTLQATKMGAPVYRRCGYADFGALGMWEHRPPDLADHAHPGAPA